MCAKIRRYYDIVGAFNDGKFFRRVGWVYVDSIMMFEQQLEQQISQWGYDLAAQLILDENLPQQFVERERNRAGTLKINAWERVFS